jgi:hypothetical protein
MPDAEASRKRQIPGCRIPGHFTTPGLLIEAIKPILETEAGTSGATDLCARRKYPGSRRKCALDPATRPLGFLTDAKMLIGPALFELPAV